MSTKSKSKVKLKRPATPKKAEVNIRVAEQPTVFRLGHIFQFDFIRTDWPDACGPRYWKLSRRYSSADRLVLLKPTPDSGLPVESRQRDTRLIYALDFDLKSHPTTLGAGPLSIGLLSGPPLSDHIVAAPSDYVPRERVPFSTITEELHAGLTDIKKRWLAYYEAGIPVWRPDPYAKSELSYVSVGEWSATNGFYSLKELPRTFHESLDGVEVRWKNGHGRYGNFYYVNHYRGWVVERLTGAFFQVTVDDIDGLDGLETSLWRHAQANNQGSQHAILGWTKLSNVLSTGHSAPM